MPSTPTNSTPVARKRTAKSDAPILSRTDQEEAAMEAYTVKITRSKKAARDFLTRAGIIDSTGNLDKHYRS